MDDLTAARAAEVMFDHNLSKELVCVDYCEKMVKEAETRSLELERKTPAKNRAAHG